MNETTRNNEADMQYTEAHAEHYVAKDLLKAFDLYRNIIDTHPESQAAEFARGQVENIVSFLIPKEKIFNNHVDMALAHFKKVAKV